MNFLPTKFTELSFSRKKQNLINQKQNLINQFINPFYKQSQQVSLNEKDLKKLFKQQLQMTDYLEGTPKAQLRKLFQTKRQQDKIQDVLKKADIRTLKHLKKGVEVFDKILLDKITIRLSGILLHHAFMSGKSVKRLDEQWDKYIRTFPDKNNQKLDFYVHIFTDQFADENEREKEKMELKRVIYKIHLMITKLFRPSFLANEWLNYDFEKNKFLGNYGKFREVTQIKSKSIKYEYELWVEKYILDLLGYVIPGEKTSHTQKLLSLSDSELTFQTYLEKLREGISSGNSNKVFSILMTNIQDKDTGYMLTAGEKFSRYQPQPRQQQQGKQKKGNDSDLAKQIQKNGIFMSEAQLWKKQNQIQNQIMAMTNMDINT